MGILVDELQSLFLFLNGAKCLHSHGHLSSCENGKSIELVKETGCIGL